MIQKNIFVASLYNSHFSMAICYFIVIIVTQLISYNSFIPDILISFFDYLCMIMSQERG